MNKLLNTIGCDSNIDSYGIEMMEVESRIFLNSLLSDLTLADYEDGDELLNVADNYFRFIADYIITDGIEKYKSEDRLYYILIDIDSCLVKYFIDVLNMYQDTSLEDSRLAECFMDTLDKLEDTIDTKEGKDIASVLKSMIIHIPIYNSYRNIARGMVCINSI